MSSLAEVSNLLVEQNTVLGLQANATMNTNKEIKKLTGYFTGLDAEEKQREASAAAPAIDAPSVPGEAEGRGFTTGMLITPGVILDLAKKFAFKLLKGGLIVALADNIGKAIAKFLGAEEFEGEIIRALTFAGIGSIFGAKFALIGAALGAVLDQETLDKITPIISEISNKIKQFAQDYLPSIETLQAGLITGLEGIRNLLQGNFKEMWEGGQVEETLLLLAGLGAVLMPGKALAAAVGTAKLAWTGIIGSIKLLGGLAGLITASGTAAAASTAGQLMTDSKGRQYVSKVGKDGKPVADYSKKAVQQLSKAAPAATRGAGVAAGLARLLPLAGTIAAFLTGPIGLAILGIAGAASLGVFATKALMETELYKNLKNKSDSIEDNLNAGVYGQGSMSLEETSMPFQSSFDAAPTSQAAIDYNASVRANRAAKEMERFGRRERQVNAVVNAPQTNSSSSSSVVQNNSIMNSGTIDPSDQINPHTH